MSNPLLGYSLGRGGGITTKTFSIELAFLDLLWIPLRKNLGELALEETKMRVGDEVLRTARETKAAFIKARTSHEIAVLQEELLTSYEASTQLSIRQFAADAQQRHPRLDVLIHNAANFDLALKRPVLTAEGVETIFATNHVGIFLMTHLLLDTLKISAPSRIITVASKGLMTYPFMDIEFDNLNGQRNFSPQHAYYHSKQAQVMYTYDLAERLQGTGVTVNCVRVGNVAIPDDRLTHIPGWLRKIYHLKRSMSMTPERQAETYVYLATDPALESVTGGYWDEANRQVRSNKNSYNLETQQRLWEVTARLAGI